MAKSYSDRKSQFISKEMEKGSSNNEARKSWSKQEKSSGRLIGETDYERGDVDRSYGSPWQDWAESSDDF